MTHQFRLKRLGLRTGALLAAGGLALGGTLLLAVGWSLGIWACGWMLASALGIMAAGRGIEGFLLFVFAPLVLALGLPSHLLGLRLIRASVRASSHPRRPAAEVFPVVHGNESLAAPGPASIPSLAGARCLLRCLYRGRAESLGRRIRAR